MGPFLLLLLRLSDAESPRWATVPSSVLSKAETLQAWMCKHFGVEPNSGHELADVDGAVIRDVEEIIGEGSTTALRVSLLGPTTAPLRSRQSYRFEAYTGGDSYTLQDAQPGSSRRGAGEGFVFEVRDMAHYAQRFTMGPTETLEAFARRICEWGDLCMLRQARQASLLASATPPTPDVLRVALCDVK